MAHPDPLPHKTDTDSDILEKITDNLGGDARWIDSLQSKKALAAKSILDKLSELEAKQDAEPIDSSKSYSEGEIVYAEGASWRVAAGGADAGDLPSTHPDKFVSFQEGVTSIANKEAAYALTGVAAGTVYKTEDTGQVLEKVGHFPAIQQTFNISDAGSPTGWIGANDLVAMKYVWDDASGKFLGEDYSYIAEVVYDTDRWHQKSMLSTNFTSPVCDESTHPADVVGAWTKVHASAAGTIADGGVTVYEPRNWKHDGTILVNDNDEKQLLTNLPDGQQVEIVGEGGRIERFNGDGDGLNEGDFKILVNHPDDPVISGMRINGIYTSTGSGYYDNPDGMILGADSSGVYIFYSGGVDWSAPINGLATPDLMSPWTAQSTNAQGYAAMTSDMITRQPTATESNWSDIIPTAEIILDDTVGSGGMSWNGSAVQGYTAVNYGWHQLDRPYSFTASNVISVTRDGTTTELELTGSGAGNGLYDHSGFNYTAMLDDNKKVRSITITQGA